jgi:hypothetical protein
MGCGIDVDNVVQRAIQSGAPIAPARELHSRVPLLVAAHWIGWNLLLVS